MPGYQFAPAPVSKRGYRESLRKYSPLRDSSYVESRDTRRQPHYHRAYPVRFGQCPMPCLSYSALTKTLPPVPQVHHPLTDQGANNYVDRA